MLCGASLQKQLEINDWTHENGVHFIAAETRGLFGYVPSISRAKRRFIFAVGRYSMTSAPSSPALIRLGSSP